MQGVVDRVTDWNYDTAFSDLINVQVASMEMECSHVIATLEIFTLDYTDRFMTANRTLA